jgi:hemerythrin-like domain-containing protein
MADRDHDTGPAVERAGDWGDAGGLPVRERPRSPAPAARPETSLGRQYRRALLGVHDWLRQELDQIRTVAGQVAAGQLAAADARALINEFALTRHQWNLAEFCTTYCRILESHHLREDREMFAAVLDVEPGLGDVVTRLAAEHQVIAGVIDRLDRVLVDIIREPQEPRALGNALAGLTALTTELGNLLLSHLAYEEDALHHGLGRLEPPL